MSEKAGKYFARGILTPENLHAAGIVAVHAGQHSTDPATGEPRTGVEVSAVTAVLREAATLALAPDAGTEGIERTLLASAALLGNLAVAWTVYATQADTVERLELYARLALKAQDQQRRTLQTLAEIRHPQRTQFIKQQNNAVNQQILQSLLAGKLPDLTATGLSQESGLELYPDPRTPATTGRGHPPLETLVAQHRPAHPGRESQDLSQRDEARRKVGADEAGQ